MPKSRNIVNLEPQLVHIPAGKFLMGSSEEQALKVIQDGLDKRWVVDELPQHTVELSDYLIGKYPVTHLEFQAYVRDGGVPLLGFEGASFREGLDHHPVTYVKWEDAIGYCKWLSGKTGRPYRLPTEAEWEKAARGTDGRIWPWGNEFGKDNANTHEAGNWKTTPVGAFSPQGDSPYGCADMIGNVFEWCVDWYKENEYQYRVGKVVKDPASPMSGEVRVLRGGSWNHGRIYNRCAKRMQGNQYFAGTNLVGFRVAVSGLMEVDR